MKTTEELEKDYEKLKDTRPKPIKPLSYNVNCTSCCRTYSPILGSPMWYIAGWHYEENSFETIKVSECPQCS